MCPSNVSRECHPEPGPGRLRWARILDHVFVDWHVEGPDDLFSDSRTPRRGFRCFISTSAWMSSAFGPFGSGLRRRWGRKAYGTFAGT